MPIRDHKLFDLVDKFHIFFILIVLKNMQWFKILRKFGFITSTYHGSPILFCGYLGYLKSYRIGYVFQIYIWISVVRRKKLFVNPLHGLLMENSVVFLNTLYVYKIFFFANRVDVIILQRFPQ